jgi:hypothetical protein
MGKHSEVFVAFDVAKKKHAVAIAEGGRAGEVRFVGDVENNPAPIERTIKRLANRYDRLHVCFEAGPTGYGLYRQVRCGRLAAWPIQSRYGSLTIVKNNYGPTGEVAWFKRVPFDRVGLLEQVVPNPQITMNKGSRKHGDQDRRVRRRQPRTVLKDQAARHTVGKDARPLKARKAEVDRAIDTLLADGRLINRTPSAQERAAHGLGPRVTHVRDVGPQRERRTIMRSRDSCGPAAREARKAAKDWPGDAEVLCSRTFQPAHT